MYIFLTACRNEERILEAFMDEFIDTLRASGILEQSILYVVDDLSTDGSREVLKRYQQSPRGLSLHPIEAPTNFGNQGAMFYGLLNLDIGRDDVLITFDCDGEDDVSQIPSIIEIGAQNPQKMVFIERGRRKESLVFKILFHVYKLLFRLITGQRVIPNNFMLIPGRYIPVIRRSPLATVHFAYAVLKLRTPYVAVTRNRRTRLGGKSSQSIPALVSHGMVGIMVFYEVLIGRLFMLLMILGGVGALTTGLALILPVQNLAAQRTLVWATVGAGICVVGLFALLISSALALVFKLVVFALGQVEPPRSHVE